MSQDILTPVLVEALSLLLGPSIAVDEEDLTLRLECVTQRFLPLTSPSPGGELLAVFRSPTVFFRWPDAIQDYLPPLYQMIDFGKVWPSLLVTEPAI